ncbi:hypothetical protein ACLHDG_13830 [Sulfurovum sp. CS9]|uniref:hypothetical protein n=1 Tax=Sulfurovum sp. CS9 TaxID=3391146 RepID=UPI0039EC9214
MNDEIYNLQISKKFLKEMNYLTKMSIKVYMSLVFLKHKRGDNFKASHYEISINLFNDGDWYGEWFGIRTDHGQYFKAFKQLEALGLIKVYRGKTKNGGNKVNRYRVY